MTADIGTMAIRYERRNRQHDMGICLVCVNKPIRCSEHEQSENAQLDWRPISSADDCQSHCVCIDGYTAGVAANESIPAVDCQPLQLSPYFGSFPIKKCVLALERQRATSRGSDETSSSS